LRSGCTVPAVSLASKGAPRLPPGRSLAALRRRRVTHNLRGAPDTPLLARSAGDKNGPIYPSRTLRARRCYASSAICEAQHAGAERRAAPRRAPRGVTAMRPWGREERTVYRRLVMYLYCFLLCECQHRQAPGSMRRRGAPQSPASLRGETLSPGARRWTLRFTSDEPATVL